MNRSALIKKMVSLPWAFHIILDSAVVIGYYTFIHLPLAITSLGSFVEFSIVLGVSDILVHYIMGWD